MLGKVTNSYGLGASRHGRLKARRLLGMLKSQGYREPFSTKISYRGELSALVLGVLMGLDLQVNSNLEEVEVKRIIN